MPSNLTFLKAIALAALFCAGSTGAQDDPWYGGIRSDWGPNANSVGFRGPLPGEFSMGGASAESLSIHKQFGGYRFTDALAIEGAQTSYGLSGKACGADPLGGDASRSCYGSAWSLAGIATLPFNSGLSLYGRLGLHYRQPLPMEEASPAGRRGFDDVGSILGVGVSFELSRAVTFHAESEHYGDFSNNGPAARSNLGLDASVHSIGLSIKF